MVFLQLAAIDRQSLTYDEPYHLLAGYQALARGENLVNWEHPPLVKMVAVLPLLAGPPVAPTSVTAAYPAAQFVFADPARERRIRLAARTAILIAVVLPLFAAARTLGRRLAGPGPAGARTGLVLTLLLGLSFSTLPHLATVQTDAALALGLVLTVLAGCAYLERPGWLRAAALGAALGLALAAKLSGVLLLPTAAAAVALAPRPGPSTVRRLLHLGLALLVAFGLLDLTYRVANRRYDPDRGRAALRAYVDNRATLHVGDRLAHFERPLLAAERASPGLAQWLTGLLGVRAQDAEGVYNSFAFGGVTARGRWWYFPAVFLLKTPLPILLATLLVLLSWRRPTRLAPGGSGKEPSPGAPPPVVRARSRALAILTAAVYLLAAITSSYNLGLRHLLPVLPLLYFPAALWAARTRLRATLIVLLAAESLALAPLWMSATNTWWLGRANPTRFALGDTNLEYHQNFLALAAELERRGIDSIGVAMPAVDATELACYLPQARLVTPGAPLEPGWYALNVSVELVPPALLAADPADLFRPEAFRRAARDWSALAAALAAGEDHGYAAGTFHLHRIPEPPPL